MKRKTILSLLRGGAATFLSIATLCGLGLGVATTWRSTVDSALGTSSYSITSEDEKYVSTYTDANDLMNDLKDFAVQQGQEGTVIMKNDNSALPLTANQEVALYGLASYTPYTDVAGNTDRVDLIDALEAAGYTINSTLSGIYDSIDLTPNTSARDYEYYQIIEVDPDDFVSEYSASSSWEDDVDDVSTAIITFMRPGGEGTTYKPGTAVDMDGNYTGKDPLALSEEELGVVEKAKSLHDNVVVLLNTSCTIELEPIAKGGDYEVDAIVYVGIPNDYQFHGIVDVLGGEVNSTGRLADTYAASSVSSPAMENFGGAYYSDYNEVLNFVDERWTDYDGEISNDITGSFGGDSYNGGYYIIEAEGIYTGYNYYETRYYDALMNPTYNASSSKGVTQGTTTWDYEEEVCYTFGSGLSYIPYTQTITNVEVEDRVDGNVTATIEVKNESSTDDGLFTVQLYVSQPYTDYDRANLVEKSAIMFLNSTKVEVEAGNTETVEISIPTKYLASYDYTNAKTYIMDGGTYYFTAANGAHEAVNNVIKAQSSSVGATVTDRDGESSDGNNVQTWYNEYVSDGPDVETYSVSESGEEITNAVDNVDINYYIEDLVTYLSRQDWDGTYPINYCEDVSISLLSSTKSDEWLKELRNQQYTIKTDDPVQNIYGIPGTTFSADEIDDTILADINDPYWERLVQAIPAEEAVGAVAHGGSQSDTLTNIDNPVVIQNDGPKGFNSKSLSNNNYDNPEEDRYYVDPDTEAGQFRTCVNSQTLMGSSFSPELARQWGKLLGNSGLWLREYHIWAGGLNYHRSPYNGRNTEYLSEDPMLTNVLGRELVLGTNEFGILNGPKHIGFNDQEHNRAGISVYMNEQKFRQTDLRGFQGAVEEGNANGLMMAFNRVGAINASHSTGLIQTIIRNEWGFQGLISTDMMNNEFYFNPESAIMASVTQMADFRGDNSHVNLGDGGVDATWPYISPEVVYQDNTLVEAARQALKYQLYVMANSAVLNISTTYTMPYWEAALISVCAVTAVVGALSAAGYFVITGFGLFKKEEN